MLMRSRGMGSFPTFFDVPGSLAATWCIQTGLCPDHWRSASQGLMLPEVVYPPMAAPPTVKAPENILYPASGAVNDVLAEQMSDWQGQSQRYFDEVANGLPPDSGGNWWAVVAVGAAVVGAIVLGKVL